MAWNCWVSEPHHCMGSTAGGADVAVPARPCAGSPAASSCGAASRPGSGPSASSGSGSGSSSGSGSGAGFTAGAGAGAAVGRIFSDSATSFRLTFMPCRVDRVMRCTSSACMVALRALVFWSSQKCTAFRSLMRRSSSSTSKVGAIHWLSCAMPAMAEGGVPAPMAPIPPIPPMLPIFPMPAIPAEACCARFCRNSKPGTKEANAAWGSGWLMGGLLG